jgi:hypothetical protein
MQLTGHLRKNDLDRWEIVAKDGSVVGLSSGSVVEVHIGGHWIETSIEFCHDWSEPEDATGSRGHYYATERGILLCDGLPARIGF